MNILKIEINGKSRTLKEWSDISGVNPDTIRGRYNRGWRGKALIQVSRTYSQIIRREEIEDACKRTDCFQCPFEDCINDHGPYPECHDIQVALGSGDGRKKRRLGN